MDIQQTLPSAHAQRVPTKATPPRGTDTRHLSEVNVRPRALCIATAAEGSSLQNASCARGGASPALESAVEVLIVPFCACALRQLQSVLLADALQQIPSGPAIVRRPCENRSVSLKGDVSVLTDVHGQLCLDSALSCVLR